MLPPDLGQAVGDDAAMQPLRLAALALADGSDLSRCDDHQVVQQLQVAVAQGRLPSGDAVAPTLRRLAPVGAPPPPAPAPPPASAARAPAAAVAPPPAVETTFGLDLDVAAMVAVLQQAAQDGTPFCEECARAAAAQRAAA